MGKTLPVIICSYWVTNNPTTPDINTPNPIGKTKGKSFFSRTLTKLSAIVIADPNQQSAPKIIKISKFISWVFDPHIAIEIPIITKNIVIQVVLLAGSCNINWPKIAANIGAVAMQNKTTGAGAMEIPIQNKIVFMK